MKQDEKKQIKLPFGYPKDIAKEMGCTVFTVYRALKYETYGRKAVEIRERAIEILKELATTTI